MVAWYPIHLMIVEHDHVRLPCGIVRILEQRRIGSEPDDVLIPLHPQQECRLRQRAFHGGDGVSTVDRVLPQEYLRPASVIVIE